MKESLTARVIWLCLLIYQAVSPHLSPHNRKREATAFETLKFNDCPLSVTPHGIVLDPNKTQKETPSMPACTLITLPSLSELIRSRVEVRPFGGSRALCVLCCHLDEFVTTCALALVEVFYCKNGGEQCGHAVLSVSSSRIDCCCKLFDTVRRKVFLRLYRPPFSFWCLLCVDQSQILWKMAARS